MGSDAPKERWVLDLVVHMPKADPPSRREVCAAACSATLQVVDERDASAEHRLAIDSWRTSGIRKLVRRARGLEWDRVVADAAVVQRSEHAQVAAFLPRPVDQVPDLIARLQISNFASPSVEREVERSAVVQVALAPLSMSVGKAAAQAAHAAQLLAERLDEGRREAWRTGGWKVEILEPASTEFGYLARSADVVVRDAGFTEVAPGSVTACALSVASGRTRGSGRPG